MASELSAVLEQRLMSLIEDRLARREAHAERAARERVASETAARANKVRTDELTDAVDEGHLGKVYSRICNSRM